MPQGRVTVPLSALVPTTLLWSPERFPELVGPLDPARGELEEIGRSREGRPLYGVRLGRGPRRISLIAGAHADEPLGPAVLLSWARFLGTEAPLELLEQATFVICPHINPDGAERNKEWVARYPCPIETYLESVRRELPGDDVEFGFPLAPPGAPPGRVGTTAAVGPRPENMAVAAFLARHGPYHVHASLHGMAIAEGAWFLIEANARERSQELREELTRFCQVLQMPLHDWNREGEKGFHRIAPGFCTTPTSTAMREHFLAQGDATTADRFRPSSMEFVRSLGGSPLCLVSEIPLFCVHPSAPMDPPGKRFLEARRELEHLHGGGGNDLADLKQRFGLAPLDVPRAASLVLAMVLLASECCSPQELSDLPQPPYERG